MVWKCPKCSFKTKTYAVMQKHYYRQHHKAKAAAKNKGQDKKVYVFKPMKGR